jgi:aerobic-type carbon monoxide dehydrogenase small subunit (CoxS/CutS family)
MLERLEREIANIKYGVHQLHDLYHACRQDHEQVNRTTACLASTVYLHGMKIWTLETSIALVFSFARYLCRDEACQCTYAQDDKPFSLLHIVTEQQQKQRKIRKKEQKIVFCDQSKVEEKGRL